MDKIKLDHVEVLSGIAPLIDRYQGFLLDQWGVLHDGKTLYAGVITALETLRDADKTVVILSNSGKRSYDNQQRMAKLGIGPDLYDAVITSGEAAWQGLKQANDTLFADLGQRCLFFSHGNDRSAVENSPLILVGHADDADFVLMGGLDKDPVIIAQVEAQLEQARQRGLVLVCSNPDFSVVDGETLGRGPGALAQTYEQAGGKVRYIGKPWSAIYKAALSALNLPLEQVVAIGDSIHHDIKGAVDFGIDGALVTQGVHRDVFANATTAESLRQQLATLCSRDVPAPQWLLSRFQL